MSGKILNGVTVIDVTTFVTGGFCTAMLANQGAEVIKIERPGVGDPNREAGPPFIGDESPYFWSVNYGKKSIELDLKTSAGLDVLYRLVEGADVFVQNFRPGVAKKLDISYDELSDKNPSIIYCDISAFGQTGPWRDRPGYDLLIQGLSGIMSVTGEPDGRPVKVGLPITDLITAMWSAFGIINALYNRERTGDGEYMDIGMFDATLPWLTKQAGKVFGGDTPERMGTKDPVLAPYQSFPTADGYINVAALNQKLWADFCTAIDREDLIDDPRFETNADRVRHLDELEVELESTLSTRETSEWMTILVEQAAIPAAPVHDVSDALYNEQIEAREVIQMMEHPDHGEIPVVEHPLNYLNAESGFESHPPKLGEHTIEVLQAFGLSEADIDHLDENGVFSKQH